MEAEAVKAIMARISKGKWAGVISPVVEFEIQQIPDPDRMIEVGLMAQEMQEYMTSTSMVRKRAGMLGKLGFGSFDAAHLACAEKAQVDVFLTTDDMLLKRAVRLGKEIKVQVANPLTWFGRMVK